MSPVELRHELHRHPELSGEERGTARTIADFFGPLRPDRTLEGLGGAGLAFVFEGEAAGPTVLLRADLDALPIQEANGFEHRSRVDGVSHKCGHDGHMAILAETGRRLAGRRPARGRVVLLFQPAEETGSGAAAVLADPGFAGIEPDFAFALHNLPGHALGQVVVRAGAFSCASRGVAIELEGISAHAAEPEKGLSPAGATSRILDGLGGFAGEAFATVVGARLGERAFGVAAGRAEIWATLRATTDAGMERLVEEVEELARSEASAAGLALHLGYEDVFPATVNAPEAVAFVRAAAGDAGVHDPGRPFRWSEDFGHFTARFPGALFGLGAGPGTRALHHPEYDFPDALIPLGADLFGRIVDRVVEGA